MSTPKGSGVLPRSDEVEDTKNHHSKVNSQRPPPKKRRNKARSNSAGDTKTKKKTITKTTSSQAVPSKYSGKVDKLLATKWDLLPDILRARGLVKQHIKSYNYFINNTMKDIVRSNRFVHSDVANEFSLEFKNVRVGNPHIKEETYSTNEDVNPMMCRIRDLTYSAPIWVDVVYKNGVNTQKQKHLLGRIPVMLRSEKCVLSGKSDQQLAAMQECPFDPGGYFVVRGFEKVILIQEQLRNNRIFVDYDDTGHLQASVVSASDRKSRIMVIQKRGRFYVQHNKFSHEIPYIVMMKAMGITSDHEIVALSGGDRVTCDRLALSLQECSELKVQSRKDALDLLGGLVKPASYMTRGRRRTNEEEAHGVLTNIVLVHCPVDKNTLSYREKAIFLALMVKRIIRAKQDRRLISDKDFYGNKRLMLAGELMAILFEDLFKTVTTNIKRYVDKVLGKPNRATNFNVLQSLSMWEHTITSGFTSALSSGNWVVKRFRMDQKGVTETVTRLSYISSLGHMTRVRSNVEKSRKVSGPRALHASQWGSVCPSDTPEGDQCGLVKSLALLCNVTTDKKGEEDVVRRVLLNLGIETIGSLSNCAIHEKNSYMVILNGRIIGSTICADKLVRNLRLMRRNGEINEFVSFYIHSLEHTVNVSTDGGRVCRPLLIVDPKKRKTRLRQKHLNDLVRGIINFETMLRDGIIEYVDVNEENSCNIALRDTDIRDDTTHVEIDPVTILGVVSALIPFPHHNQSPRNTYQCAMGKQAIGTLGYNQLERCNVNPLNMLVYPQKPMVRSKVLDFVNFDKLGGGQNAMVAVMSYSGYDIEDAVIINRASLDRGYGRAIVTKRYTTVLKKNDNNLTDEIMEPPKQNKGKFASSKFFQRREAQFKSLDSDGVARVGATIHKRGIMLNRGVPQASSKKNDGKMTTTNTTSLNTGGEGAAETINFDASPVRYKESGEGRISKVVFSTNGRDQETMFKILVRDFRRPELGDKYSSRHGQKGVIGLIVSQEDLPFNEQGVCPDMIMNPHGFPSRMTVGKMMELVDGKAGLLDGARRFGTAFSGDDVVKCGEVLTKSGYSYSGKEILYSGITGDIHRAYIFIGPIYYQRLKHMVKDKMFARASGPRVALTRQPTQGRSRNGGLRVGEMERDCLVAHGVSLLLVERMLLSSDPFTASVCDKCGLLAYSGYCQYCKNGHNVKDFRIPYACKLLFQELMAMNVQPKIRLREGGFFDKSNVLDDSGKKRSTRKKKNITRKKENSSR